MRSAALTLYLSCLIFGNTVAQNDATEPSSADIYSGFLSVTIGETLTLECFSNNSNPSDRYYWYKKPLGQRPQQIASFYAYEKKTIFHAEFKSNPRFSMDAEIGQTPLTIRDLQVSDSATYYCFTSTFLKTYFTRIVTVNVMGSKKKPKAFVLQSESDSIQKGSSVTLNCTVYTGSCNGEHKLYWFRSSEDSQGGFIYTHHGQNSQCDKETHTCVYNLPMNSLSLSHAGIYYCAVASCGQVLFGNGTKLEVTDDAVIYFWKVAFAFISILSASLAFLPCIMNKESIAHTRGLSSPSKAENKVHFPQGAAFLTRSEQKRDSTWSECVYTCVKQ